MPALLEAENLEAQYGWTKVLHGLSFAVEAGGITTILGANGAGKTTTLRAVCQMVKTSGQVRFDGQRIDGKTTEDIVRLGIAHTPEGRGTFVDLMSHPRLLLLDEPSLGLAPLVVREIFRIVRTINQHERVSVLLVEQNASLALDLAHHVYLLETGRVVMSGPAAELKKNDAIRRSYLGY